MPALPEESMLVEQVMHDNPETLTPGHLLKDALPVYERHGVNCVPILDENKKVRGILTIFRLVQAIRSGKSFETPISEVMDVDLVSIRNDATFGMACSMPIDRMLVLDHDDRLVGVLTKKELIHKIYKAFCSADCHNRELSAASTAPRTASSFSTPTATPCIPTIKFAFSCRIATPSTSRPARP